MRFFQSKEFFSRFCWFLMLAKLVLIGRNEIISIADDSAGYVRQSVRPWTLDYPPGYSIWLRVSHPLGIPQRVCIEGLYLLAAFFVATGVRKSFGLLAGCLTFALLTFAPLTYFLFDHALSDGFFTCLTMLAFGVTLHLLLASTRLRTAAWALGLGATLGLMAITRNEDPLIVLWVALLIVAAALTWRLPAVSVFAWRFWRKSLTAGGIIAATAYLIVLCICTSYYLTDGVFARSLALIPGHVRFLTNLARIDTGQPQLRFIPISRKSRELAYSVSPFFAKLRAGIENPEGTFQIASREAGLPAGEIGGGWIWHAINEQVFPLAAGHLTNAERQYEQMSADVEAAFKDGRLKRRYVMHPLIGGDPVGLLRRLPHSISAVAAATFRGLPAYITDQGFETALFDRACLRRAELVGHPPEVVLQGWAFVDKPARKILSVLVASNSPYYASVKAMDRPDVVKVFSAEKGWKPEVAGFYADVPSNSADDVKVTYVLDDGNRLMGRHLRPLQVSIVESQDKPGVRMLQGIDLLSLHEYKRSGIRHEIQSGLVKLSESIAFRWLIAAILLLACAAAGNGLIRQKDFAWQPAVVFLGFTILLLLGRILFYSVIDASAWNGDQVRYLAPSNALGVILLSVSAALLFALVRSRLAGRAKQVPDSAREDHEISRAQRSGSEGE